MENTWTTHNVSNQYSELFDYNLFQTDNVLLEYFASDHLAWAKNKLDVLGAKLGTSQMFQHAHLANQYSPVLNTFDSRGNRIDSVDFHPSWHIFMELSKQTGWISAPFTTQGPYRWSYMATSFMLQTQVEAGAMCPATMTLASIPILMKETNLWKQLKEKLFSNEYDNRDVPISEKKSIWIGMGMTEKQGGSDVRSNTTIATPVNKSGRGEVYLLRGHKWFMSAPMCDAHIVIAKTSDSGEFCSFFVPRWKSNHSKNAVPIQRLKNKLGNRSNASSEVEFLDAHGILIGEPGRGIPTIMEMANHTRLCCVIGSTGLMRQASIQAIAYARKRKTFGQTLYQQPLMRQVLVDLAVETEAAQVLALKLSEAFEQDSQENISARAWKRLVTPAAKYWVCKRAQALTAEAMEVFGGNGYVEDSHLTRLFREAPVNAIWEGSSNVMCLDVLRVFMKEERLGNVILNELYEWCSKTNNSTLMQNYTTLKKLLNLPQKELERNGRLITEQLIVLIQMCLMEQRSPKFMSDAFLSLRCQKGIHANFGAFDDNNLQIDEEAILKRAFFDET